tara:strand:+ start:928 stop:1704 length:777 start_codon:yes stop_codon:yes gene_type:complete
MIKYIKKFIKANTGFLIRLDDIAENMQWEYMDKAEKLFDKFNIKPVLGVIPNNNDPELLSYPKKDKDFWNKVRLWRSKGWEIGMHGNNHVYKTFCKKVDYLGHGGNTEFCGQPINDQLAKIKEGLKKFEEEQIEVRTFFAPNHTFDKNTLSALKECGIYDVLDGYGIMPYEENQIRYIPQLFYKIIKLPFGIQTIQIHLNYLKEKDFGEFEDFIKENNKKIINYDQAMLKINNNFFYTFIRILTKKILQTKRLKINRI